LENVGVEGGINKIKMDLKETGWEGMDWVHLLEVGTS
jgi:hypothetical protein